MKLIYLANVRFPTEKAHGIQIMKTCEALTDIGAEVDLIVPWRFNKIGQNPWQFYGVEEKFKIKKIPSLDLIPFPLSRIGFWIQTASFAKFALFYLLFKKTDIIYSRDSFTLFLLSFLKKNLVYEAHTFPRFFFLHRRVMRKARVIVVITEKLKEFLVEKGIAEEKILVAPDGVDLIKFALKENQKECRQKLNLPWDKKIVLYSGNLYQWKGAKTLLEAARLSGEDILFVFVGGTKKDIGAFKSQAGINKNILVAGHQPYQEIPFWLKAADLLVLPNSGEEDISRYWTSPMKMFEYMASGQPIVASDLPSLREVLNENNAVLVEPDNPKALAEGINKTLKNSAFSANISARALKDVQKYSWINRAKNIYEIIRRYSNL